jgi:putative transposon-encoded protein
VIRFAVLNLIIINNIYFMIQTVITPGQTSVSFQIPVDYVGKRVEITCHPLDDVLVGKKHQKTLGDFFGVLSEESYLRLKEHTERVRKEWDRLI